MRKIFFCILIISAFHLKCNKEGQNWAETKRFNTPEAYDEFSKKFPQSIYTDSAMLLSNKILPEIPVIIGNEIISSEKNKCKIKFNLTILHKIRALDSFPKPFVLIDLKFSNGTSIGSANIINSEKIKPYTTLLTCEYSNDFSNCSGIAELTLSINSKLEYEKKEKTVIPIEFK